MKMSEKKRFAVETVSTFAEVFIVYAENEEEARDKIMKYYEEEKSKPYSVYYMIREIDFAIHIK